MVLALGVLIVAVRLCAAEANWEAELRWKLEKEIKAELAGKSLDEVLQHLADEVGCKIDLALTEEAGPPVHFHTKGMPASKVLGWVCFLTDGRWVLTDDRVVVCSERQAASLVVKQRRRYDLSKLAPDARDAEAVRRAAVRLLRSIGAASVQPEEGSRLTVSASVAGLASVAKLLDSLPRVPRNGKLAWEIPNPDVHVPIEVFADPAEWPAAIKDAMRKRVTFDFVETPTRDVTNFLASLVEVPIIFDALAVGHAPDATLRVNDMRFQSALNWTMRLAKLGFAVTPEGILISKPERIAEVKGQAEPLAVAVHDVSDILAEGWELSEVVECLRELRDHSRTFILGAGTRVVAVVRAGRVSEVGRQLDAMRGPKLAPARPDGARPLPDQPEWVAKTHDALSKKVTFDFVETPLQDVVNFLSSLVDVTIVMETEPTRDAASVTLRVNDMRLGAALQRVLWPMGLGYELRDEAIFITKAEQIGRDAVARLLPAWGAVGKPEEARELAKFLDALLNASPGASPRTCCRVRPGYALDCVATEAHANVAEGLVGWLAHSKPGECHDLPETPGAAPRQEWEAELRRAMNKRVTFHFAETPIQEVAEFLSSVADLTIVLDTEPLKDKQLDVTLRGEDMALGTALDSMLKPLGLAHVLRDEAVLITTTKRARWLRPTVWRLYDIRHLGKERPAAADLALTVRKACEKHPEWAPSHRFAEFQNRLVICTTPAVHGAVQKIVEESLKTAPRK